MPVDPIESFAYGIARGFTQAALEVFAAQGPQLVTSLVGAWRAAWASTLEDSKVDLAEMDVLRKDQADAVASGQLPPAGVR